MHHIDVAEISMLIFTSSPWIRTQVHVVFAIRHTTS